jgi:hypothetical protein
MGACFRSDDYLPIVKILLHRSDIQVNQQNKVMIIESMSWSRCFS